MTRYFELGAVLMSSIAAITDLRGRRIPNWLTYTGLLLAVSARTMVWGWAGLKSGLAGVLVAGSIFCLLFFLGAMGGGDVKLMGAVGAWVGPSQAAFYLLAVCIAGGLIACAYLLFGFRKPIAASVAAPETDTTRITAPHPERLHNAPSLRVPFGLAIAIGTFVCAGSSFLRR